ncbi:MAG: putative cytosolic protein [Gammaproteobacteria bacterium]|jgi:hypothetical protein|nr:putative cytosolic protein [Gammaproteobacteria bacterium]
MAAIQDQLKLKIEQLKGLEDVSPIPLRGQIILAYRKEVLAALLEIIEKKGNDEEKLLADLQIFLAENWKKYGLSPVGYTALPDDPVTELLCDIATEIAQNLKNKKPAEGVPIETSPSPIHILMPGIQTQVTVDSSVYPDLDSIPLQQVIKTHIINRNGKYLLPVKFLIQITPSAVETNICNHYYNYESDDPAIRDGGLAYLDAEEKHRLFQHSFETRSVIEAKRHFDTLTNDSSNLLSHLNTLIIGLRFHSKQGLGSEGAASEGVYILILNFQQFYDKLTPEQKNDIPPLVRAQIDLLLNITDKTEARYNQVVAEGNIVPQPTVTTCIDTRQKVLSDAMRGHEATLANITLSAESKIELIKDATEAVAEAQKILVEKTENSVAYKGVDSLKIPSIEFLHALGVKFSIAHIEDLTLLSVDDFNVLCLNEIYRSEIVIAFNKDPINAYADLATFAFLSKPDMLGAVLSQFIEELFDTTMQREPQKMGMLLNYLNNERFEIACVAMSDYFKKIFYKVPPYDPSHLNPHIFFSALKGALSADKRYFLIEKILDMDRLASISQFISLISGLDLVQRANIIETHLKDLSSKIQHARELYEILRIIPEGVSEESFVKFLEAQSDHLPGLIESPANLENLKVRMPQKFLIPFIFILAQQGHLNSQLTENLFVTAMGRNPKNMGVTLNSLNNERFEIACAAMSGYFKEIFYKFPPYEAQDPEIFFSTLMDPLSADKRYFLITQIIDMSRLASASQFISLISGLDRAQKAKIIETHLKDLSCKIQHVGELYEILRILEGVVSEESVVKFLETQTGLIESLEDLEGLKMGMPQKFLIPFILILAQQGRLNTLFEEELEDYFDCYMDLFLACEKEEQKIFVRETQACLMELLPFKYILEAVHNDNMDEKLLPYLRDPATVYLIPIALSFLDENGRYQKEAIINSRLREIINSPTYFSAQDEKTVTYGLYAITHVLPEIIKCPEVFSKWMGGEANNCPYFYPEQQSIIFNVMKSALINMINSEPLNKMVFNHIMEHLRVQQRTEIFEEIKVSILGNPCGYALTALAAWLTPTQQTEFFSGLLGINDSNLLWISSVDDFINLARILNENKNIFELIVARMIETGQLAKLIYNYSDIVAVGELLKWKQMKEIKTQWMRDFLPSYNKRLSFFSNPLSAKWPENADAETVLQYANDNRTSRTTEAISEMRRSPVKLG